MVELKLYTPEYRETWNRFVGECKNATFLHNRDYMDYHNDRFHDFSLMAYSEGKLMALLPANRVGDVLYSHQGLTYGGWLICTKHFNILDMLEIFDSMSCFLLENGIHELIYKPVPHIYHKYPAEEDLYAIFRHGGELIESNVSSTIEIKNALNFNYTYRKAVKKAQADGVKVVEADSCHEFWEILTKLLNTKYGVNPVHSLAEIELLKRRFPQNIRLFTAVYEGKVLAGTLIYDTGVAAHAQYITATDDGKAMGALPVLFRHIIDNEFEKRKYFDFGISNEEHGRYLNEGLALQKNHLGGRAIVYNTYKIKF